LFTLVILALDAGISQESCREFWIAGSAPGNDIEGKEKP
jgi:hypothetical protein